MIIGNKMAAVRAVSRFLRFATVSAARTVNTHAGSVCNQRAYTLIPLLRAIQRPRQAAPFVSSYYRRHSSASEEKRWDDVYLEEFIRLLKEGGTYIIDVREPWELEEYGKFPESVNIPCGSRSACCLSDHTSFSFISISWRCMLVLLSVPPLRGGGCLGL